MGGEGGGENGRGEVRNGGDEGGGKGEGKDGRWGGREEEGEGEREDEWKRGREKRREGGRGRRGRAKEGKRGREGKEEFMIKSSLESHHLLHTHRLYLQLLLEGVVLPGGVELEQQLAAPAVGQRTVQEIIERWTVLALDVVTHGTEA